MAEIKAVLFDGYGTLFADGMERLIGVCGEISSEQGLGMDGQGFLDAWDPHFFSLIRDGEFITFHKAHQISLRKVFEELDVDADVDGYVDRVFTQLGLVRLFDDVNPTLGRLDGVATGVVSNADSGHLEAALERNGLSFPIVVSSESARCYKPRPDIFNDALAFLGVNAEEVLYVGDSQEDDIVAAKRAGIPVAWLNRDGDVLKDGIPEPDYEVATLADIPGIL